MNKKLHIYYFSTALSDEIYDKIVKESRRFKPTFSGVGFDRNVALGLYEQTQITGVSLYPIPSYPKFSKVIKKKTSFKIGNFVCYVPSMVSLPIIKEYCYGISTFLKVRRMLKKDEENVILISGLYKSLIRPAKWLKKWSGLKICAIVPDIPELMMTYRKDYSPLRKILNRWDMKRAMNFRDAVDGFVVLSSYMNPVINRHNRPWVVMDGLCHFDAIDQTPPSTDINGRYLLYAGKISTTFGVDKLVEGFLKANLKDVKLCLCGDGDYALKLREIAKENNSVIFNGPVTHNKVLALEKSASVLVDPRPIDTEIAKMSFPSKIIEYMASGTPVLVSNIPSFQPEYEQYQYRISEVSVDGLCNAITTTMAHSDEELKDIGSKARTFVLENKTIQKQCKKVVDMIERIIK